MSEKIGFRVWLMTGLTFIALSQNLLLQARDQNVSGQWALAVETPEGKANPSLDLRQDGEKISGTYVGRLGKSPVEGSLKGDEIKFSVKLKFRDRDFTVTYTGTVEGDQMEGKVRFGDARSGSWTARRQH
jgi:hypothetical protein